MARNRLRWALGCGVVLAIPLATPARALLIEYAFSVQVTSAEPPLDASFTPGAPATVVALIDDATAPGFPVPETARYFGAFVFGSFDGSAFTALAMNLSYVGVRDQVGNDDTLEFRGHGLFGTPLGPVLSP